MKTKCPYNCKCTRKIKDYCCAEKGFVCTAKEKADKEYIDNLVKWNKGELSFEELKEICLKRAEQLMIENADVLKRLKN